jgi:hypothetical protein
MDTKLNKHGRCEYCESEAVHLCDPNKPLPKDFAGAQIEANSCTSLQRA